MSRSFPVKGAWALSSGVDSKRTAAPSTVVVEQQRNLEGGVGVAVYADDVVNIHVVPPPSVEEPAVPLGLRVAAFLLAEHDRRKMFAHVSMAQAERNIHGALVAGARCVVVYGLPGAGKTTLLRDFAQSSSGFFLRLDRLAEHEVWSSRGDFAVAQCSDHFVGGFHRLLKLLASERENVVICLDGLERVRDVRVTARRIVDDISSLPRNVQFVLGLRHGAIPEDQLLELKTELEASVVSLPILRGADLDRFLLAYGLPRDLPNAMRRALSTPFMVDAFAKAARAGATASSVSGAMSAIFRSATAANSAKKVFLHAYSAALVDADSYAPVPIALVQDTAAGRRARLSITECDVEVHGSPAAHFHLQGLMVDDGSGLEMTHDRLAEYLAATELLRALRHDGPVAVADRLLSATPKGLLWSATDFLLEMLASPDERASFIRAVIEPAARHLHGTTPEARKAALDRATTVMHWRLAGRFNELSRLPRDDQAGWLARCAAYLAASMYLSSPAAMTGIINEVDRDVAWWLWSAILPEVIEDPFFFTLIDGSDQATVQTAVSAFHGLAKRSLGVTVPISESDPHENVRPRATQFSGPQLPLEHGISRFVGPLDMLAPAVLVAVTRALPALLNLMRLDRKEIAYLDALVDYVARFLKRDGETDPWANILSDVTPEALMALAPTLSSAYPLIELSTLLLAAHNAFQKGASWNDVQSFNMIVVGRAIDFAELQLATQSKPAHHLWAIDRGCATLRMGAEIGGCLVPVRVLCAAIRELESVVLRIAGLELCEQHMARAVDAWHAKWRASEGTEAAHATRQLFEFFAEQGKAVVDLLRQEVGVLGLSLPEDTSVLAALPDSALDEQEREQLHHIRGILGIER